MGLFKEGKGSRAKMMMSTAELDLCVSVPLFSVSATADELVTTQSLQPTNFLG
ncbi:hypothetical protein QN219_14045 [Sinorhizobium sp. 7-81]|uniref:hypothetical protein n=1 Tax=Sinorhizobium sp. 8-89 TaxID=3049089 RepID=UPI0024C24FA0|nr:hypothetical protein [Sinorhizobium sp. 8-89]MDK1491177.1 hypothetical protein [Sinorhizobium sp. 8-89]